MAKHLKLTKLNRYRESFINHLYHGWYKMFLGSVGDGTLIRKHCRLEGDSLNNVKIGEGCCIDSYCVIGCRSELIYDCQKVIPSIIIGNGCIVGQYNHITAVNAIIIGDNLLTGRFVLISDNNHGRFDYEELKKSPVNRDIISKGKVIIGNNVWIGDKVSILGGVHIGDGCIIGANSVVTHDIPPYSLAVGNPARIVKTIH